MKFHCELIPLWPENILSMISILKFDLFFFLSHKVTNQSLAKEVETPKEIKSWPLSSENQHGFVIKPNKRKFKDVESN